MISKVLPSVCIVIAVLVLSSVTACPAMAAKQAEPQLQNSHFATFEEISREGKVLDLKNISESQALKNANIIGGEISLYYEGAIDQEGKEGRFTVRTHPLPSAKSGADAMDHPNIGHPVEYPQRPCISVLCR